MFIQIYLSIVSWKRVHKWANLPKISLRLFGITHVRDTAGVICLISMFLMLMRRRQRKTVFNTEAWYTSGNYLKSRHVFGFRTCKEIYFNQTSQKLFFLTIYTWALIFKHGFYCQFSIVLKIQTICFLEWRKVHFSLTRYDSKVTDQASF